MDKKIWIYISPPKKDIQMANKHPRRFSTSSAMKWSESRSVMSDSMRPHGLDSPWNSPGQNTGVGNLSLLQGIFPTQAWNPGLPHYRQILYHLSYHYPLIHDTEIQTTVGTREWAVVTPLNFLEWGLSHCMWLTYLIVQHSNIYQGLTKC